MGASRFAGVVLCATFLISSAAAAASQTAAVAEQVAKGYRLGAGDKVRITVFGEDNLSGQFIVSTTGAIAFPLIGDVAADGLTVDQVADAIRSRLQDGFLREPKVGAEVLTYRPFYILGEVNKPGEYPYVAGLTVMKAVATAGGYTYRANTRRVMMRHVDSKTEQKVNVGPDNIVQPGDTIRVVERFF